MDQVPEAYEICVQTGSWGACVIFNARVQDVGHHA